MAIWYGDFVYKRQRYCYYKLHESEIGISIPNSDIDWGAWDWFESNGGYQKWCVPCNPPTCDFVLE